MSKSSSCSLELQINNDLMILDVERKLKILLGDFQRDQDDSGVFLDDDNFVKVCQHLRAYLLLKSGPVVCRDGCSQLNPKKRKQSLRNISTQCYHSDLLVDASTQVDQLKDEGSQTTKPNSSDAATETVNLDIPAATSPIPFENENGPEKGRFFPGSCSSTNDDCVFGDSGSSDAVVLNKGRRKKIVIKGLPKSLDISRVKSGLSAHGIHCFSAHRKKSRRNGKFLKPVFCQVNDDADLSCCSLCDYIVQVELFRSSTIPKVDLNFPVPEPPPARRPSSRRGDCRLCHLDSHPSFLSRTSQLDVLQEAIRFFQVGFPFANPVQLASAARILVDPPQASSLLVNN